MNENISLIESGVDSDHQTPIDLNQIIRITLRAEKKRVKQWDMKVEFDKLPVIKGNVFLIRLLFYNLLSNAINFKSDEVPLVIRVLYSQLKGQYIEDAAAMPGVCYNIITFSDNGIGFKWSKPEKMFNLFNGVTTNNSFTSTRLGLAVCQKIMYSHEGFITAESKGDGAAFNCFFPTDHL